MSTSVETVKSQLEQTKSKLEEHKSYFQKIEESIKQLMAERDKVLPLIHAHEGAIQAFASVVQTLVPEAAPVIEAIEVVEKLVEGA